MHALQVLVLYFVEIDVCALKVHTRH